MTTQVTDIRRAVTDVFRWRVHKEQLPIVEWLVLLLIWAISLAMLYLLWWKANPPWWA